MAKATLNDQPAGVEPTTRRRFQETDLQNNNNKFWMVEGYPLPSGLEFILVTYGRVGTKGQKDPRIEDRSYIPRKIKEKLRGGYSEVSLADANAAQAHTAPQAGIVLRASDPATKLIEQIFREAGEQVKTYLAPTATVDRLSLEQIDKGRAIVNQAAAQLKANQGLPIADQIALANMYYKTVPTPLPHRIKADEVAQRWMASLSQHEDALNQLEAAVSTLAATTSGQSQTNALGIHIQHIARNTPRWNEWVEQVKISARHDYVPQVEDVYEVEIPTERAAYIANQRGTSRVEILFHGTSGGNMRHIMKSGLIIPRTASNGRNFGDGVYFAPISTKAANYASARYGPAMLMIAEVAVGNFYVPQSSGEVASITAAPRGYDSVWAKAGTTKKDSWSSLLYDENIVYTLPQQTIRCVVTFRK